MHQIIAVTPAGRRRYLELLSRYVLADDTIDAWQLWDNCRDPRDREYLDELVARDPARISVVRLPGRIGDNRSINRFYAVLTQPDAFYIKLDDDIVYLPPRFGGRLYLRAREEQRRFLWWSPLVINNALCTWALKYHSEVQIDANVSAQAGCAHGWRSPELAILLHRAFLHALRADAVALFEVPDFAVSLARFSINCIGFFGRDVIRNGARFCPDDVDDEEWLSAVLPSQLGRQGRIVGNLVVSHFSFFTQERELLRSGVLSDYYRIAGLRPPQLERPSPQTFRQRVRRRITDRLFGLQNRYDITVPILRERAPGESECRNQLQQL